MRLIAILFLIFGVGLAGGAIYYGQQVLGQYEAMAARKAPEADTVRVIVAKRRLVYGDRITGGTLSSTFRWVEWPAHAVPEGVFREVEEIVGDEGRQERVVLRTIEPGEPILRTKLSGTDGSSRVAARLGEGKRAFTIPINAVSGVAGLVRPGDRVDILLTRTINRDLTTSVILQNVLVIATDQISNVESDRARVASTATVEVTAVDAQKLALAQQVGRLTLTLRGAEGSFEPVTADAEMDPININDLPDTPVALPAPTEPEADPSVTVRVRKGGEVKNVTLE